MSMRSKILILSVILVTGCAMIRERVAVRNLQLKFTGVEIAKLDLRGVTLNLHWKARNPNAVDAVLDGFELDIFANGQKIGHASTNRRIRVPHNGTQNIVLPLKIGWSEVSQPIRDGIRNKKLQFRAQGYAIMDTPFGKIRFKVMDKTGNIR